jgi:pyrroline-5-carboxylate reductase
MFIEAIAEGAVSCGLPMEKALEYAAAAVAGAAELLLQSGQHPADLRDAVCSPGGSTIAGVRKLQEKDFGQIVMDAIRAAYQRNIELGK